jgi:GT2 family glycosyltransferase
MTVTVIVVTLNRPECIRTCLQKLSIQAPKPDQIIVVDASTDDATQRVVAEFPEVEYLHNVRGFGRMTASRNIGLKSSTGDVIAFVDDDAFAHSRWLSSLLASYSDASVGAVGGRVLSTSSSAPTGDVGSIGRLQSNGMISGLFELDPGHEIDVDHVMGCNMSFRREVLAALGGFREDYPGISGVREDSDMCLRVKRAGYRIIFNPAACVDHLGAAQAKGQRFDTRYVFYAAQNHVILLIRNYGVTSPRLCRYLFVIGRESIIDCGRRIIGAVVRHGTILAGSAIGLMRGMWLTALCGSQPERKDREAGAISRVLAGNVNGHPNNRLPSVVSGTPDCATS